jgi:beta-lactamase regulating signal transducer with metallopeptidase domain
MADTTAAPAPGDASFTSSLNSILNSGATIFNTLTNTSAQKVVAAQNAKAATANAAASNNSKLTLILGIVGAVVLLVVVGIVFHRRGRG